MEINKLKHHLNCIKMCQSDKAIEKRIETIFAEGNENGWREAGQCPKCMKDLPEEEIRYCDECSESSPKAKMEDKK